MEQVGTQADPVCCDRDVWVWVSQPAAAAFINLDLQGSKRHIITAARLIPSQSRSRRLKGPCLTPNSWRCCDLQLRWRSLCCATLGCCCRLFMEPEGLKTPLRTVISQIRHICPELLFVRIEPSGQVVKPPQQLKMAAADGCSG